MMIIHHSDSVSGVVVHCHRHYHHLLSFSLLSSFYLTVQRIPPPNPSLASSLPPPPPLSSLWTKSPAISLHLYDCRYTISVLHNSTVPPPSSPSFFLSIFFFFFSFSIIQSSPIHPAASLPSFIF
ncbi:uncharacterized protein BO96DRAFT_241573 [Aspergillus niger CBS 101883]|uniref:uncharacterized protein n=1 Tax=Aspergillus lacticoffeatus (strain CBS 101883) TaxID=1450533 RepID=UPI000D802AFA|nr:uncharacterized protein BO96DRAFT_241573 [Aspergillus niger CBS 101883]PYH58439.1 hypothetical protein BO96DRAFT_241573 [Aspergillus niger CBS 101883]